MDADFFSFFLLFSLPSFFLQIFIANLPHVPDIAPSDRDTVGKKTEEGQSLLSSLEDRKICTQMNTSYGTKNYGENQI